MSDVLFGGRRTADDGQRLERGRSVRDGALARRSTRASEPMSDVRCRMSFSADDGHRLEPAGDEGAQQVDGLVEFFSSFPFQGRIPGCRFPSRCRNMDSVERKGRTLGDESKGLTSRGRKASFRLRGLARKNASVSSAMISDTMSHRYRCGSEATSSGRLLRGPFARDVEPVLGELFRRQAGDGISFGYEQRGHDDSFFAGETAGMDGELFYRLEDTCILVQSFVMASVGPASSLVPGAVCGALASHPFARPRKAHRTFAAALKIKVAVGHPAGNGPRRGRALLQLPLASPFAPSLEGDGSHRIPTKRWAVDLPALLPQKK